MLDFYCQVLGMKPDNQTPRYIVALKGLNSEIRLQRVDDEIEKEVIGRLELETDEAGFNRLLANRRSNPFEIRADDQAMELVIRDPDGNLVQIHQEAVAQAA